MLSSNLAHGFKQQGDWVPHVQTHCSHGEWRGDAGGFKVSYYAWWASTTTPMLSRKLAHDINQQGGWGGGEPPPIANTMRAWLAFKKVRCQASLHKRGVGGAQPPPFASTLFAW